MRCFVNAGIVLSLTVSRSIYLCANSNMNSSVVAVTNGVKHPGQITSQLAEHGIPAVLGFQSNAGYAITPGRRCPSGFAPAGLRCEKDNEHISGENMLFSLSKNMFWLMIMFFCVASFFLVYFMHRSVIKSTGWKDHVYFAKSNIFGFMDSKTVAFVEETRFLNDRYEARTLVRVPVDRSRSYVVIFHDVETGLSPKEFMARGICDVESAEWDNPITGSFCVNKKRMQHPEITLIVEKTRMLIRPQPMVLAVPFDTHAMHVSFGIHGILDLTMEVLSFIGEGGNLEDILTMIIARLDLTGIVIFRGSGDDMRLVASVMKDATTVDEIRQFARGLSTFVVGTATLHHRLQGVATNGWRFVVARAKEPYIVRDLSAASLVLLTSVVSVLRIVRESLGEPNALDALKNIAKAHGKQYSEVHIDENQAVDESTTDKDSLIYESTLYGCRVKCSLTKFENESADKSRKFPVIYAPERFRVNEFARFHGDPEDVRTSEQRAYRVTDGGRHYAAVQTFNSKGLMFEYVPHTADGCVVFLDMDTETTVWVIDSTNFRILWAMVSREFGNNRRESDWRTIISSLCDPPMIAEVLKSAEHVRASTSITATLEVKLRVSGSEFRWHELAISRTTGSCMCVCATSIDRYKQQFQLFRKVEDDVHVGLEHSNVQFWQFDDTCVCGSAAPETEFKRTGRIWLATSSVFKHTVLPDWYDRVAAAIQHSITHRTPFSMEVPMTTDKFKWVSFRGFPTDTPGQLMGVALDVTELKEAMRALDESRQAVENAAAVKSQFLMGMWHTIQSPTRNVCTLFSLLSRSMGKDEGGNAEMIKVVDSSLNRLNDLINDTLDLSMIEQDCMTPKYSKFDLREVVSSKLLALDLLARAKGLEIVTRVDPGMPNLYYGELHFFTKILRNLVSNAIKFTISGQVSVELRELENGSVQIIVEDTGIGISPEDQVRIWGIFTQIDASATRLYGGMGTGLPLTKRLLNLIDGSITLESKIGEGSTFTVMFPFEPVLVPFIPRTLVNRGFQVLVLTSSMERCRVLKRITDFYGVETVLDRASITGTLIMIAIEESDERRRLALEVYEECPVPMITVVRDSNHPPPDPRFYVVNRIISSYYIGDIVRMSIWKAANKLKRG